MTQCSGDGQPPAVPKPLDAKGARCKRCGADFQHTGLRCQAYASNLILRTQALQAVFQGGMSSFAAIHRLSVCDSNSKIAVCRAETLRAQWELVEELMALGLRPWQDFITFGEVPPPVEGHAWSALLKHPVVLSFRAEWLRAVVVPEELGTLTIYYVTDLPAGMGTALGTFEDTTGMYTSR